MESFKTNPYAKKSIRNMPVINCFWIGTGKRFAVKLSASTAKKTKMLGKQRRKKYKAA
jgi:hypothetical protein